MAPVERERRGIGEVAADYFILETADRLEAVVVSNDTFDRFRDRYPWVEQRRGPLMIVRGEVELYEQKLDELQEKDV